MERAAIGFPRWTTEGVFTAGGGSYVSDYPVTNLATDVLSAVARTSSAAAADTKFMMTFADPRGVRLLAFVNHNASLDATFRIRLYSDEAASDLIYDSGEQEFWPPVYPFDQVEWEDDQFWSLQYSSREIAGYRKTRPIWLGQIYLVQAIKVEVVDTTNTDGFFQCGLFDVSQGSQVTVNFSYGSQYGFEPRTDVTTALGGAQYFRRKEKPRIFRGSIKILSRDEALVKIFENQRQHDIDTPFLWLPNPESTFHLLRECFLARNASLPASSYASFNRDTVQLDLREVL